MFFLIAMFIVGISCLLITYKTLMSYSGFPLWIRILVFFLLFFAWFSPVILRSIRDFNWINGTAYAVAAKSAYFLMGFAFILVMLLILREVIWYAVYYISRNPELSPDNVQLLNRNNLITVVLAFAIACWGVWEANKTPNVENITITDNRIKENTKIVVASDLHIDRATPLSQIKRIVDEINAQNPDYILLVGDIVDDVPDNLELKIAELKKLKANKIFLSLGNHEYYNAPIKWMIKFTNIGFEVLQNTGNIIEDTGLYIAGIPDAHSANVNYDKAFFEAKDSHYKILMSHTPTTIKNIEDGRVDLQVSGHTHGGQIFPFHFLVKEVNGFLAGIYKVGEKQLYITRGAGYWGPPLRVLAPSDITVINLKGEKNE